MIVSLSLLLTTEMLEVLLFFVSPEESRFFNGVLLAFDADGKKRDGFVGDCIIVWTILMLMLRLLRECYALKTVQLDQSDTVIPEIQDISIQEILYSSREKYPLLKIEKKLEKGVLLLLTIAILHKGRCTFPIANAPRDRMNRLN